MCRVIFFIRLIISISMLSFICSAHATITCHVNGGVKYFANNISSTVAVGPDTPVGTILYFATLFGGASDLLYCNADWSLTMKIKVNDTGDSLRLSSSPYSPGDYYPTNVPGIGYMFIFRSNITNTKNTFTGSSPLADITRSGNSATGYGYTMGMYLALVKTAAGPVSGNVNINMLHPTKYYSSAAPGYAYTGDGVDSDGLTLGVFNFTGNVIVQTPSCEMGDQLVDIGDHVLNQDMKAVGDTTVWKDASVVMKNCANFTGFYSSDANGQSLRGSGTVSGGTLQSNLFSVSLTPVSTATNDGNIALTDSEGNLVNAAKGYALQLGYTPDNLSASATQPAKIWKPGDNWNLTVPLNSSGTIKIPLAARLIKTSSNVMPGPANAKVIVSVSYK